MSFVVANLIVLCSTVIVGCATSQVRVVTWNTDLEVEYGERVELPSSQGEVTFAKIVQDRRCPIDAQCITGGTVIIELIYTPTGGESEEIRLSLGDDADLVHSFSEFSVELKEVTPLPWSDKPVIEKDYRVTLLFSEY